VERSFAVSACRPVRRRLRRSTRVLVRAWRSVRPRGFGGEWAASGAAGAQFLRGPGSEQARREQCDGAASNEPQQFKKLPRHGVPSGFALSEQGAGL